MRPLLAVAAAAAFALVSSSAFALTQPNGLQIPTQPGCNANQPTGLLAAFACACTQPGVCNIGAPCTDPNHCDDGKHGTCEATMWHAFNDNTCIPSQRSGLDPYAEASTTPETFHPTCALTFTVQTRGTAIFKDVFGWYNVTGQKPDPSDLHPMLACGDAAGSSVVLDIKKEPAYRGGDVGFFLLSPEGHPGTKQCSNGDCCATLPRFAGGEGYVYYSERKYNPDAMGASSFIHLLVYGSHVAPHKFYFAWEDILGGSNGDFTDLVTSVDGVECSGAGVTCDTGGKGTCALGVTACTQGIVGCQQVIQPSPEACNGVDDDCNGSIDDAATCPNAGDVCDHGACVPKCKGSEFRCGAGKECEESTGLCVESGCANVSCAAGTVCHAGACVTPCGGVVCPAGQTCIADECRDLCAQVKCAPGEVCDEGVCLSGCNACGGISCAAPLACGPSGACVDPSCAQPCPSGTVCKSGACVDSCDGVKCPAGQTCAQGQCAAPGAAGADAGLNLGGGDGGSGADGGADNADTGFGDKNAGCACRAARARDGRGAAVAALLLGLAVFSRRARARRSRARGRARGAAGGDRSPGRSARGS